MVARDLLRKSTRAELFGWLRLRHKARYPDMPQFRGQRPFQISLNRNIVRPYLLADIGEGENLASQKLELPQEVTAKQESQNARSSNGQSGLETMFDNSIQYAKCSRTKRLLRYSSVSCSKESL